MTNKMVSADLAQVNGAPKVSFYTNKGLPVFSIKGTDEKVCYWWGINCKTLGITPEVAVGSFTLSEAAWNELLDGYAYGHERENLTQRCLT